MFCPNCGAKNTTEQKFCRSCGMNLEQTAITLADQFGMDRYSSFKSIDRFFSGLGKIAFGGFSAVMIMGVAYLLYIILTRFVLSGSQRAFGIFLFLFVTFASLSLVWVIYNESRKDRKKFGPPESASGLASAETGKLLNASTQQPIPSVVEDTTDLLHAERPTRNL